jgi:hypothetical protein
MRHALEPVRNASDEELPSSDAAIVTVAGTIEGDAEDSLAERTASARTLAM